MGLLILIASAIAILAGIVTLVALYRLNHPHDPTNEKTA